MASAPVLALAMIRAHGDDDSDEVIFPDKPRRDSFVLLRMFLTRILFIVCAVYIEKWYHSDIDLQTVSQTQRVRSTAQSLSAPGHDNAIPGSG
jgi:hypothetical protein